MLNLLPLLTRIALVEWVLRVIFAFRPHYSKIAYKNLALVFPGEGVKHAQILRAHHRELARLIVDAARLDTLNEAWIAQHIQFEQRALYEKLRTQAAGKGILLVSGHLGSFELLAYSAPFCGSTCGVVVRPFKAPLLNQWWIRTRELSGNTVISRNGAYREMVRMLRAGSDVSLLFDQNVRRKHGVFVPWFGRPAATTRALALAALETEVPVVIATLLPVSDDYYRLELLDCGVHDIYLDTTLTTKEKVACITKRVSEQFQKIILRAPESWFWYHRRWRTTEDPEGENFYS